MNQELLLKFFEVNEFIKGELKKQKGSNKSRTDKNRSDKNMRLSLNSKNTLRILNETENINQRNLAKQLNITAQAMSEIIKNLEQAEFIEKRNNKINNENIISITEKGKEKAKSFNEWITVVYDKVFSNLTEKEKDLLFELLNKIYEGGDSNESI